MTRYRDLKKPKFLRWLTSSFMKCFGKISYKFKVNQKYKIPDGPKIFTPNHPTTIDPFFIASIFPNSKMLVHYHAYHVGILAWLLNKLGHIKTDVRKGKEAYNKAREALQSGNSLIIFPEGNYSIKKDTPRELKTGVIRLALETGVPIVPIGIKIDPENVKLYKHMSSENVELYNEWYKKGIYHINIGKSIKLKGNPQSREYVKRKSRYLHEEIQKLCRK
jgi:1-acyl-sn-glycerol-3-phosphate acyltransferase